MRHQIFNKAVPRSALAVAVSLACGHVQAFEFDTGDPGLKVRWDNTFKYSTIYRLRDADRSMLDLAAASGGAADDGNRNFRKKGIVSNRLDWISELDVVHGGNKGFRISGAAWYDDVYHHSNDNDNPLSANNLTAPYNQFTSQTRKDMGGSGRLMDAFVFLKGSVGDSPATVRLGRHAVIYGETLIQGDNGIAAAQGPVDIVKAATVPGAAVKDFLLPTNQISGQIKPADNLTLGGYYQFKWEKSPLMSPGSFLSPADFVGSSAESFLPGITTRDPDMKPKKGGQWGAMARFKFGDTEYGLYAANFHDKTPSAYYLNVGVNPALTALGVPFPNNIAPTTFTQVYQQNIKMYGASASTVLGSDNVSLELSMRENQPLTGGSGIVQATTTLLGGPAHDNDGNPAYAVGKTAHAVLADIHIIQPNALFRDGGSLVTQLDWHSVSSVTKNPSAIDPTTTRSASRLQSILTADFFQVADGLDISIPIGLTYNLAGRSRIFAGAWATEHGGSLDVGLNFTYLTHWKGGLNYHHFLGKHGLGTGNGHFDQTLWDRDYISFNLSRAF